MGNVYADTEIAAMMAAEVMSEQVRLS